MSQFSEEFQSLIAENAAFALWRMPGETKVHACIGADFQQGLPKVNAESAFIISPFDENEGLKTLHLNGEVLSLELQTSEIPELKQIPAIDDIGKDGYIASVERALKEIAHGSLSKVVVAQRKELSVDFTAEEHFLHLLKKYPAAFCSYVKIPRYGEMVGATPELLLKWNGHSASTMALAGTLANNAAADWRAKETDEQQIVLKEILLNLKQCGIEQADVSEAENLPYGNLKHRLNRISWNKPYTVSRLFQIAKALHPTPAIGGLPRDAALKFIAQNEAFQRGYYAGYLGVVRPDGADFYVNIRQAHFGDQKMWLTAGAGIVSGSIPQDEWLEIQAKMRSLF